MKTIRKDWPGVRQYVKAGNTYFSVDLRGKHHQGPPFKNFTSRDEALKYASESHSEAQKGASPQVRQTPFHPWGVFDRIPRG